MSQYSTFFLGEQCFGLPILTVREIINACEITPVPLAPRHVRGLINLRGQIVTILDLAARLGIADYEGARPSHVVILNRDESASQGGERGGGENVVGFLVDAIGDAVEADRSRMEAVPANVSIEDERCLDGVAETDAGLLVLLNLESILGARA